jgi:hypothetical protein
MAQKVREARPGFSTVHPRTVEKESTSCLSIPPDGACRPPLTAAQGVGRAARVRAHCVLEQGQKQGEQTQSPKRLDHPLRSPLWAALRAFCALCACPAFAGMTAMRSTSKLHPRRSCAGRNPAAMPRWLVTGNRNEEIAQTSRLTPTPSQRERVGVSSRPSGCATRQ